MRKQFQATDGGLGIVQRLCVHFFFEEGVEGAPPLFFSMPPTARPPRQFWANAAALVGWAGVLGCALVTTGLPRALLLATLVLETLCVFEVAQIALGLAVGNVALGVAVHAVRLAVLCMMPVTPHAASSRLVLLAWSATEVARYPMFLFPGSRVARRLRYLAPLLTFPIGALAETHVAYGAIRATSGLAAAVVALNLIGGPAAYRALIRKAQRA